ncbi:MAG: chorismate mutase [Clostridiales Family XIII bacterium]|jgi:chorismate mutase/prephenate dehydratase|nr:chorismate mutase [Clostridiales Family XIII bacterium]
MPEKTGTEKIIEIRKQIDELDAKLVESFTARMGFAKEIGEYKRDNNLAITDEAREDIIVKNALAKTPRELSGEVSILMRTLMALSREYQRNLMISGEPKLLPPPAPRKTRDVKCVYQGVPGAWSWQAAQKLFPDAKLSPVDYFEDVFTTVKNGGADYGVMPIENSRTGAIGETYDLLRKYGCYIVGRTWIDIRHCLMAKSDTDFSDIREVHSHSEGFGQCRNYLAGRPWDLMNCSNTAVAAKKVKSSADDRSAAIGSRKAAEIYGLSILQADIMDQADNRTSFVIIGREPEYDESSDHVSVTFSLAHRSGSLCEALMPYMAAGIDLARIESRPASAGSFRFFAEIEGTILDDVMLDTLRHAAAVTEYFEVIGCYSVTE